MLLLLSILGLFYLWLLSLMTRGAESYMNIFSRVHKKEVSEKARTRTCNEYAKISFFKKASFKFGLLVMPWKVNSFFSFKKICHLTFEDADMRADSLKKK